MSMVHGGWQRWLDHRHYRRGLQEALRRCRRRLGLPQAPVRLPVWQPFQHPRFGPGLQLSVAGRPLWLCSWDGELAAHPAAALCALGPWAASRDQEMIGLGDACDPQLAAGVQAATAQMGRWWGHPALRLPELPAASAPQPAPSAVAGEAAPRCALFFSGGVDSFFSLLRGPRPDLIVFVIGFDVALGQRPVWQSMVEAFRRVAAERGIRLLVVATNLREHHALGAMNWERYHAAALACVGHLLREQAQQFLISASFQASNLKPWGTHPDLDALWSDRQVSFVHSGCEVWRADKLAALADEPLVHRYLRVCYADPSADGNCGRCEKCVRTRLIYWQDLPAQHCATMPQEPALAAALDALVVPRSVDLLAIYQRFYQRCQGESAERAALGRLCDRLAHGPAAMGQIQERTP